VDLMSFVYSARKIKKKQFIIIALNNFAKFIWSLIVHVFGVHFRPKCLLISFGLAVKILDPSTPVPMKLD
jgi:hypothetical protein